MPMPRHAFVCQVCMEPIPFLTGRYEKRLEYRRADGRKRLRVLTIGYLCRTHALDDIALEERRAPGTVAAEQWKQEEMFPGD